MGFLRISDFDAVLHHQRHTQDNDNVSHKSPRDSVAEIILIFLCKYGAVLIVTIISFFLLVLYLITGYFTPAWFIPFFFMVVGWLLIWVLT